MAIAASTLSINKVRFRRGRAQPAQVSNKLSSSGSDLACPNRDFPKKSLIHPIAGTLFAMKRAAIKGAEIGEQIAVAMLTSHDQRQNSLREIDFGN